jgi:DNA-directed RNA polymerase subunit M/transcription elongation factor TFIIS
MVTTNKCLILKTDSSKELKELQFDETIKKEGFTYIKKNLKQYGQFELLDKYYYNKRHIYVLKLKTKSRKKNNHQVPTFRPLEKNKPVLGDIWVIYMNKDNKLFDFDFKIWESFLNKKNENSPDKNSIKGDTSSDIVDTNDSCKVVEKSVKSKKTTVRKKKNTNKVETDKTDANKTDANKVDANKADDNKVDANKVDANKADDNKAEADNNGYETVTDIEEDLESIANTDVELSEFEDGNETCMSDIEGSELEEIIDDNGEIDEVMEQELEEGMRDELEEGLSEMENISDIENEYPDIIEEKPKILKKKKKQTRTKKETSSDKPEESQLPDELDGDLFIINSILNKEDTLIPLNNLYTKRKKIIQLFSNIINDIDINRKIEMSIYNYTINRCKIKDIFAMWEAPEFCEIYNSKSRSLYTNLDKTSYVKNTILLDKVINGEIDPVKIAFMSPIELYPEVWMDIIEENERREKMIAENNKGAATDMFRCPNPKCRQKKATYTEVQTRSADEPMTIFLTCLVCGKRWRQ